MAQDNRTIRVRKEFKAKVLKLIENFEPKQEPEWASLQVEDQISVFSEIIHDLLNA